MAILNIRAKFLNCGHSLLEARSPKMETGILKKMLAVYVRSLCAESMEAFSYFLHILQNE